MTVAYRPEMRASDGDREKIAARLRDAHAEGRLTITEFQDRLDALYKAQTYGELEPLVRDIPVMRNRRQTSEVATPTALAKPARSRGDKVMAAMWTIWACAVSVNLVIWLLAGITNGELIYFWPAWVAGPWGAVLLSISIMRRQLRD